ncbi:MAG: hypothetical protein AAFX95_06095 [Cyanobacteria bacterium J06639_16]
MTSQKTQIQNLIAEIDTALNKASPRLPWVVSGEVNQQRQLLEKTRSYLVSVQQMMEAPLAFGTDASGGLGDSRQTPTESAQQVLQAVLQEMTYLRTQLVQPMRTEVSSLQQQRDQLLQDVKALEIQQFQQQSSLSPQPAADLMQELMERLQATLSEQIRQTLTQLESDSANAYLLQGTSDSVTSDTPRLSPANRLKQFEALQSQSDQLLLKLDSTLRVVFESLQSSIESYQDSLVQGLDKMHDLGQQGEVIFTALINHLAQQLSQDASAHIEANRLSQEEQAALSAAQPQAYGAEAEVSDNAMAGPAAHEVGLNLDNLDLDADIETEDMTLLQLDEEITQFQLDDDEDITVFQVSDEGVVRQSSDETAKAEQDDTLLSLLNQDDDDETVIEIGTPPDIRDAQQTEDIDAFYESLFGPSAIAPNPQTQPTDDSVAEDSSSNIPSTAEASDETLFPDSDPSDLTDTQTLGVETDDLRLPLVENSDSEEDDAPLEPSLETAEIEAAEIKIDDSSAINNELVSPPALDTLLFDGVQAEEAPVTESASAEANIETPLETTGIDSFFGEAGADTPLDETVPPPSEVIESLTDLLPENADADSGNRLLSATELLDALDTELSTDPSEESWTEEGFIPAPPEERLLSDDAISNDDENVDLNISLDESVLQALNEDLLGLEGLEELEQPGFEGLGLPTEPPVVDPLDTDADVLGETFEAPQPTDEAVEPAQSSEEPLVDLNNHPLESLEEERFTDDPIAENLANLDSDLLEFDDEGGITDSSSEAPPVDFENNDDGDDNAIAVPEARQETVQPGTLEPEALTSETLVSETLGVESNEATWTLSDLTDSEAALSDTDVEVPSEEIDESFSLDNLPIETDAETDLASPLADEGGDLLADLTEPSAIEASDQPFNLGDLIPDTESEVPDEIPAAADLLDFEDFEPDLLETGSSALIEPEISEVEVSQEAAFESDSTDDPSISTEDNVANLLDALTTEAPVEASSFPLESEGLTLQALIDAEASDTEGNDADEETLEPDSVGDANDLPDLSLEGLDDSDFTLPDLDLADSDRPSDTDEQSEAEITNLLDNLDLDNLDPFGADGASETIESVGLDDPISISEQPAASESDDISPEERTAPDFSFESLEENIDLDIIPPDNLPSDNTDEALDFSLEALEENTDLDVIPPDDTDEAPDFSFEALEGTPDLDIIPSDNADEASDFSLEALEENTDLKVIPPDDTDEAPDFSFESLENISDLDLIPPDDLPPDDTNEASDFSLESLEDTPDLDTIPSDNADEVSDFSLESLEENPDLDSPLDDTGEAPAFSLESLGDTSDLDIMPSDDLDEQVIEPTIPDDVMADFSTDLELPAELAQELSVGSEGLSTEPNADDLLAELPELTLPDFDQNEIDQSTDADQSLLDFDDTDQSATTELNLPDFEALTDLETVEVNPPDVAPPPTDLPDFNEANQSVSELETTDIAPPTTPSLDNLDFEDLSLDEDTLTSPFTDLPDPDFSDLTSPTIEFEIEDIEIEDIEIEDIDIAPLGDTLATDEPIEFEPIELGNNSPDPSQTTDLDLTPPAALDDAELAPELRTPLPEVGNPPLDLPEVEDTIPTETDSLLSPEAAPNAMDIGVAAPEGLDLPVEAIAAATESTMEPAIAEPPAPLARTVDPNHAWFLGIDFGTTGLSVVLLDQVTDEVYPIYWHNLSPEADAPERIFRLPAIVDLTPAQAQSSSQWQIQASGLAAIQTAWQRSAQPATEMASGGLLLRQLKPLLKVGIPHRSSSSSDWQPTVQWSPEHQISLQLVQAGLSDLLQNLQTPNTCAALGLEAMPLRMVLQQLTGVIVGYPPNWPDTYGFNLREAILATGLVTQPDQIFFIEEAIATVLSGLPNPAKVEAEASTSPARQQALYNSNWQGGTVVICAGATLTELALVDLPNQLSTLAYSDFALKTLNYAGDAIDQDIICQLLLPAGNRQTGNGRGDTPPNPFNRYASGGWNWQPNLPTITEADWDSLQLENLTLPRAGEPDLIRRRQLQQHLEGSLLGQSLMEAARYLKLILQHQGQFQLELGNQRWTIRRRELESQIFLPYIQHVNRHINMLLTKTGLSAQGINQVICTGGSASLPAFARWLRQKFPNATIIQDTYPSDRPASCSRVAYGLVNLARYPNVLDITRQQYSDYFLLRELLRHLPEMPLPVSGIMHRLEQQGLNTQACQMHLLALLEGHLPPGMVPTEADQALLSASPAEIELYRSLVSQPLFTKQGGQTYVPNPDQAERLAQHLDTLLAGKQQQLEEPLIAHLGTRVIQ